MAPCVHCTSTAPFHSSTASLWRVLGGLLKAKFRSSHAGLPWLVPASLSPQPFVHAMYPRGLTSPPPTLPLPLPLPSPPLSTFTESTVPSLHLLPLCEWQEERSKEITSMTHDGEGRDNDSPLHSDDTDNVSNEASSKETEGSDTGSTEPSGHATSRKALEVAVPNPLEENLSSGDGVGERPKPGRKPKLDQSDVLDLSNLDNYGSWASETNSPCFRYVS